MVNFDKALHELKGLPASWPKVSCVNFIEKLSEDAGNQPDYSEWKAMTEGRCMAKIGKNNFKDYIEAHRKCLGPDWRQEIDGIIKGDVVFFPKCQGVFAEKETGKIIEWHSLEGFPATLFAEDDKKFWGFAGKYGLKMAHPDGEPIAVFRRRVK